jgi:transporter family-2 protein
VKDVGAGAFAGLTITANILMSLIIDKFGMFGMAQKDLSSGRMIGAALMVAGIGLISKF